MRTTIQLTFATHEASQKLRLDDPIKVIFDYMDWSFIYPLVLDKYSPEGADGYDPTSLYRAQLLIYLGEVKSDRMLAKALRFDTRLCLLCGFNFMKTPSNGTFSIFRKRLGVDVFYEILHHLIAQAIAVKVILGGGVAVDSSHLWAFSNKSGKKTCSCKGKCTCPKKYSDSDGSWGHKTKTYSFFGYKVHLIVDAKSQLPLDVTVTTGDKADCPQAKPLFEGAREKHPDVPINFGTMDCAYDAYKLYRFLIEEIGAVPIIALNPRNAANPLTLGSLTVSPEGGYTCLAGHKVVYDGKERKNGRLKFRCPAAVGKCQCLFRSICSPSAYGRTFHLYPNQDYRLVGPVPRGTDLWQEMYNTRTSSERTFSELKGSHSLNNLRVRHLPNVKIHVYLALGAQILKRIGAAITTRLIQPKAALSPLTT